MKKTILIVDDEGIFRTSFKEVMGSMYKIVTAFDYDSAFAQLENHQVDLIILDIHLGMGKSGVDILKKIRTSDPHLPIIMLSTSSSLNVVVDCMKFGAADYLDKTTQNIFKELTLKIQKCIDREKESRALDCIQQQSQKENSIIGSNPKLQKILNEIEELGDIRILIEGETGVGKTPLAKYANTILAKGKPRPFVHINCAGLSRERIQDELFGHKRGAFTGAEFDKKGLIELAEGGDLFLDEIGDIPLECQAELLIFLDSGEYRRLGDPVTRYSNCRVIAATNCDLKNLVEKGSFRKDLYSRISIYKASIPTLKERKDDIPELVNYYINKFCGFQKDMDKKCFEIFVNLDWEEGNIRELKDAVYYMCQKGRKEESLKVEHISPIYRAELKKIPSFSMMIKNQASQDMKETILETGFQDYLGTIEKRALEDLVKGERSIRSLATKLKLPEATLFRKLKKHDVTIIKNNELV